MPHSKAGPAVLPTSPELVSAMADRITPSRHFTARVRPGRSRKPQRPQPASSPKSLPGPVRDTPRRRETSPEGGDLCVCLAPCTHYIITAKIPFVKALFGEFEGSE